MTVAVEPDVKSTLKEMFCAESVIVRLVISPQE